MTTMASSEIASTGIGDDQRVELPLGLLGFERIKKYSVVASPEEAPFLWLQMAEDPKHAFLVVPPAVVFNDYRPDLSEEDVRFLGIENPADAWVLNIVTLRHNGSSTVNLKGPVVFNRRTRVGKQVIPLNAASFPLQHPLGVVA